MPIEQGFTVLGAIFVPLAVLIASLRPRYLLGLIIVAGVFQGGAVLNYLTPTKTVLPVNPFYFVETAVALVLVLDLRRCVRSWRYTDPSTRSQLALIAAFAFWAALSAFVMPVLFQGVLVDRPRAGLDAGYFHLEPLQFSLSNVAQAGYIVLNSLLLAWVACAAVRWDLRVVARRAFAIATGLVVLLGLYQKLGYIFGWPFPSSIIDSNGVVQKGGGFGQTMALLGRRVSATFSEPSFAGAFLAVATVYYFVLAIRSPRRRWPRLFLAFLTAAVLLWTGSSTGYLALAAGCGLFAAVELAAPLFRGRLRLPALLMFAGVVLVGGTTALVFWNPHWTKILDMVVLQKDVTASAVRRFAADRVAWGLFLHTKGFGVGLGSERPSSFLLYLLANVGLIGVLAFAGAIAFAFRDLRRACKRAPSLEERAQLSALGWALGANFVALAASIPDLTWEILWVLWAMAIVFSQSARRFPYAREGRGLAAGYAPASGAGWRAANPAIAAAKARPIE